MHKNIAVVTANLVTGGGDRLLESIYSRFVERWDEVTIYVLYPSKESHVFWEAGIMVKTPPYFLKPLLYFLGLPIARRFIDPLFHAILTYKIKRDNAREPITHVSMYHYSVYPLVTKLKQIIKTPFYYTEISSPKGRTFPSTINEFDKVFVPSVTIGKELEERENLKNGFTAIPFFVTMKEHPPLPPHPHLPQPTFGAIARLSPEKDLGFLIKTLARINQVNPDIGLVLIGEGPEHKNLKKLAEELGVSKNVKFIPGFRYLNAVMKEIDVVVLSSDIEGMPLTLIEAMAYGKPIVATPAGSVPEMITHGENGFVCSKNNPDCFPNTLRAILENEYIWSYMSQCSRKRYEETYDASKVFPKLYKEFD